MKGEKIFSFKFLKNNNIKKKMIFFQNFPSKLLQIRKKVVPLHPN